jgi:hypothetical protein
MSSEWNSKNSGKKSNNKSEKNDTTGAAENTTSDCNCNTSNYVSGDSASSSANHRFGKEDSDAGL